MSKLSELLNPAPASGSQPTSPTTENSAPVRPLVLDGQMHRKSSISYGGASGSPLSARHPSITSPGLEALADAASNTAPLASPTQHNFTQPAPFPPNLSHYGSRPSSSHTLPPLSTEIAHPASLQNSAISSGLEHYHHPTNGERRLSNITDPLARLPPLQRSPTDTQTSPVGDAPQPLNGIIDYASGVASDSQSVTNQTSHQTSLEQHPDATSTSQADPSPLAPSQSAPNMALLDHQRKHIQVKSEISDNILEMPKLTRRQSAQVAEGFRTPVAKMESPAPKHLAELHNGVSSPLAFDSNSGPPSAKPRGLPSKKRAAPKKGMANAVKPAKKKRKVDNDSVDGTASAHGTGTPATSRTSMTPAPKNRKQGSETPARSSSVAPEDEEGSEEDNEAYCICRKPDDHTLMIACDGPCEDWFHVRCVQMDSVKAKLISKWYCPNCAEKGLETLWKRMCRLEGCQEPARQDGQDPSQYSKYCCDEHGVEFMRCQISDQKSEVKAADKASTNKRRRKNNYTDNFGNAGERAEEEPDQLRGGVLRAAELKAVTDGVKDLDAFHRLGDGVLSPPPTASPEGDDVKTEDAGSMRKNAIYTPEESNQLEEIAVKRDKVRAQKRLLDDRDRLLNLVTTRSRSVLAELKEKDKSINTICGYDTRLTWSDEEFNAWRTSPEGKSALEKGGVLGPPAAQDLNNNVKREHENSEDRKENGAPLTNGHVDPPTKEEEEEQIGKGVCKKKRCERHKTWLKLMQHDILLETHQARQAMKKLEAEEKGVRDRAMIRTLEAQDG